MLMLPVGLNNGVSAVEISNKAAVLKTFVLVFFCSCLLPAAAAACHSK